jgi:phage baseplate assembly protein W
MTDTYGTDLRLLPDLEKENDRFPGADVPIAAGAGGGDLATVAGVANLKQALLLRFLTPLGALTSLGHPGYGSAVPTLVGQGNTETNRGRLRLFVLATLARERRIAEVLEVTVAVSAADPTRVGVTMRLRAVDADQPITLGLELDL